MSGQISVKLILVLDSALTAIAVSLSLDSGGFTDWAFIEDEREAPKRAIDVGKDVALVHVWQVLRAFF